METAELLRADGSLINVNDRVSCDGFIGTVKFIGNLNQEKTKGIWLGVDWDNEERGKHDGSLNGVQYFTTSTPKSGSFVRPKKVNGGVSCYMAIKDRYGKQEEENAGVIADELYVVDSKKKKTIVEMVGAEFINLKQSNLNYLQEVVLKEMLVYGVGIHGNDLMTHTRNIQELDISKNLLSSWENVANIAKCLPNLENLNVSENRLELPKDPESLRVCFPKVKVLFMNRMRYSWEQIMVCSSMFPRLEQLHICFNCLKMLTAPTNQCPDLRLINLESNDIDSWQQVLVLNHFNKLESLILNDNSIELATFPDVKFGSTTSFFPHLRSLCINYNKISQWSSIDELNKLQKLEDLQITHNPLLDTVTLQTARQLLIAKISTLKKCNRTEADAKERKEAEVDYLKRFGPDWLKAGGGQDNGTISEEFTTQHPRYLHFISVYGAAENSEMTQKPKRLKDSLLPIKVIDPDNPNSKVVEKKVPATMTIQKLKTLIQRLFKESSRGVKLSYISTKMPGPEIEFDNDLRQINFFSLEAGDTIYARFS